MLFVKKKLVLLIFLFWNGASINSTMNVPANCIRDTGGSGNDSDEEGESPCCKIGNCDFFSLDDALNKVSSNDLITITSHVVTLSSLVTLESVENITFIGHTNPTTVICNDIGAVKFVDCNNVTIRGINWERCGSNGESTYPGVSFYNSSEVVLLNCYLHNSTGPAVVLANISGIVSIKHCHFAHNKYRGHGAALYYLSLTDSCIQTMLEIDNSSFEYNGPAKSIVYINDISNCSRNHLKYSMFINNKGVPIHIFHTNLHLSGSVLLKGNEANNSGGIYSNGSTVTCDGCNVNFFDNLATASGGALYQISSKIFFRRNSNVTFTNNSGLGGAIYSQ